MSAGRCTRNIIAGSECVCVWSVLLFAFALQFVLCGSQPHWLVPDLVSHDAWQTLGCLCWHGGKQPRNRKTGKQNIVWIKNDKSLF